MKYTMQATNRNKSDLFYFPVVFVMYLICCDAVLILCYFKNQN